MGPQPPTAAEFLRRVLPDEGNGFYVATVFRSAGARFDTFHPTIERLSAFILQQDALGNTVYHACASYAVPRFDPKGTPRKDRRLGRSHYNAQGAQSFWLDVDAGEGKPYANALEAHKAVEIFRVGASLPPPLYVSSGTGLHVYWPLVSVLGAEQWKHYAQGLKNLCALASLHSGPERTADISSILRTPETTHRKREPYQRVFSGPLSGPYHIDQFKGLLDHAPQTTRNFEPAGKTNRFNGHGSTLAGRLAQINSGANHFSSPVADRCAQIGALRSSSGRIIEPLWHAAIGVLAFCQDGEEHAHEWSSGYERYTHEETQGRIDRWKETVTGATTCERFHSLNPAPCQACPHWQKIKSPISLGHHEPIDVPAGPINFFQPDPKSFSAPEVLLPGEFNGQSLPVLPQPYGWANGKLVLKSETKDGRPNDLVISSLPIYLASVQRGETRGDFDYLFRQYIPSHGWIDIDIPASSLFGPTGGSELARNGANIHDHAAFARFVHHSIDGFYTSGKLAMQYEQFGWKGDDDTSFCYGMRLYTASGTQPAAVSNELRIRSNAPKQWLEPARSGSLIGWKNAVERLFSAGVEGQSIAVLASFGAPLLKFTTAAEGGAVLSLVTGKSARGKTTALIGASSVWGDKDALDMYNRDTQIAKALTLGAVGNLPLFWDELRMKDPEVIRDFVGTFTYGRDKLRANRNGELKHATARWVTTLITASNMSMVDVLKVASTDDDPEALAFRVLELPCNIPPGIDTAYGEQLHKDLIANRGWAGDEYMKWLVQPESLAWAKDNLQRTVIHLHKSTGLDKRYRYWIRLAATIIVAGAIVKHLGLIDFSIDRITRWLKPKMQAIATPDTDEWATATLGAFFDAHRQHVLIMEDSYTQGQRNAFPLQAPTRELFMRYDMKPKRITIASAPLREWLVKREVNYREWVEEITRIGVMVTDRKQCALAAGTQYPSGRVLCVEVNVGHPRMAAVDLPSLTPHSIPAAAAPGGGLPPQQA